MSNIIEQKAGNLDAIIIERGNSWKTNVTFDFNISAYTIAAFIKFGTNTVALTVTPIDAFNITIALTNTASQSINVLENLLYLRLTYNSETRDYIKTLFKVIQ